MYACTSHRLYVCVFVCVCVHVCVHMYSCRCARACRIVSVWGMAESVVCVYTETMPTYINRIFTQESV